MEHLQYPNESADYRAARNALLDEEIRLRAQIEKVAAQRRALPPGGELKEDYVFERIGANLLPEKVKLSELFGPHDTLILYSFMYGPSALHRAPAARISWTASTAPRGICRSARRFMWWRNRRSL